MRTGRKTLHACLALVLALAWSGTTPAEPRPPVATERFEGVWTGTWKSWTLPQVAVTPDGRKVSTATLSVKAGADGEIETVDYCFDGFCGESYISDVKIDFDTLKFVWGGEFAFTLAGNTLHARYKRGKNIAMFGLFTKDSSPHEVTG